MLSSVLHSERAIQVNIAIMRAFVQLREMIGSNKGLARRLNELEKKYDSQFRAVFEAIRELMAEPESKVKQETGWSLMIFCARATRGRRLPSLDARSGRSISPHP
jgi:hypothetical protein